MSQDLAEGRSREAMNKQQLLQAMLQNKFAPEQMEMQREQHGWAGARAGREEEAFSREKTMWPLLERQAQAQTEGLEAQTDITKYTAKHKERMLQLDTLSKVLDNGIKQSMITLNKARTKYWDAKDPNSAASHVGELRSRITGLTTTIGQLEKTQVEYMKMLPELKNGKFVIDPMSGTTVQIAPADPAAYKNVVIKVNAIAQRIKEARATLKSFGVVEGDFQQQPMVVNPYGGQVPEEAE
jgi:hypothetical protein